MSDFKTIFPFKNSLMFYIFKNAAVKVYIKFLKCSKNIKETLKQINGYFCDELAVYHNNNIIERIRKLLIKNGKLKYTTEFCDHCFNELNPLKIRDTLTLHSILNEGLIQLLPKLNICFIKNIDAFNLKFDSGSFLRLLNPRLLNIRIYISTINGNDDILNAILLKCSNLKILCLPWQSKITNLIKCSGSKNGIKLDELYLYSISEFIEPKTVATFSNNFLNETSKLSLCFNFSLPSNFVEQIKANIISKNINVTAVCFHGPPQRNLPYLQNSSIKIL